MFNIAIVASTSVVRPTAMLVLLIIESFKAPRWLGIQWCDVYNEFHKYR
jgi:hypothetical protein